MSEQESIICAICGGMTRIAYTIEFRECVPHSISVDPNQVAVPHMRLCPGHPEPAPKHDGILDARSQYFRCVLLTSEGDRQVVIMDDTFDGFGITPKQALSLRDWLIQKSPELERLAKEQAQ